MENRTINYQKLTPIVTEDISYYQDYLNYAYSEKDILNIALTGRYGAGKSSVWRGYESKKNMNNSTIHISLTNFDDINISSENKQGANETDKKSINRIEFQILNQILYQIESNKIPSAKYKVKQDISKYLLMEYIAMFTMFTIGIILVLFEEQIKFILMGKFKNLNTEMLWLISTVIFLAIPPIAIFRRYLMKQFKYFDIKRISFKNNQFEFDSDEDESLFDRDQDEIVYIIRESGIKTIVFEDLDRFNNIEIFNKLRNINRLVNLDKKEEEKIRFVYMLRDDVFLSKDRTKFFDIIIPIVPILDSSNSKGVFLDIFRDELSTEYSPDKKMLERISIYVDDMRLLKNIYNEYIIYLGRIDAIKRKLDPNKLLGIITYKNIFPTDYENLQQNKGYIFELFYRYKKKIGDIIKDIQREIETLNDEIIELKQMIEDDHSTLIAAYFPTDKLYEKAGGFENLKDFAEYLLKNPDEQYVYRNRSTSGYARSGRDILKELDKNQNYNKNKILLNNDSKTVAIKKREDKIQQLEDEKKQLNSMTLKELLERHIDDTIFEEIDDEIIKEHYFPLIRFLIVSGYIDETYKEYLSYFYESSITANDQIFLRSIYENTPLEYEYRLDNSTEVLSNLETSDFTRDSSLNFELLKVIIQRGENDIFKQILETIYKKIDMSFFNKYLNYCNEEEKSCFINKLIEHDTEYLNRWLKSEEIDTNNRLLLVDKTLILSEDKLLEINTNNKFDIYLESTSKVLEYYNGENIGASINGMISLDIKFKNLSISDINDYVLKSIVKSNLYDINFININYIINRLVYSNNGKEKEIASSQYTIINTSRELNSMKININENIQEYLTSYIESISNDIILRNSENDTIVILNSEIDKMLIDKYINQNKTILTSIDCITNTELWKVLLKKQLVCKTHINAKKYYETIGSLDKTLLEFINAMEYDSIVQWSSELDEYSKLETELINSKNVSIDILKEITQKTDYKIQFLNIELSNKHIELLIKQNKIEMNEGNIMLIYENYEENIVGFIESEIIKYFDVLDKIDSESYKKIFSDDLIYSLLNSSIDFEYKKMIIEKYDGEFKLSKVINTGVEVKNEIIKKKIDVDEIPMLINSYYDSENRQILKEVIIVNFYDIKLVEIDEPIKVIEDLILGEENIKLGIDEKSKLLCLGIEKNAPIKCIKTWLKSIPEMKDLYTVFNAKRPIIYSSSNQYNVALKLEELGFISLSRDKQESNAYRPYLLKKGRNQDKSDLKDVNILL
ncbi:hypothetical protein BS638_00545 [Clostridium tepidum]|uniref:YobI-like P-loop NTPase domain-containing protein n=1 Tax=Clostridium tepidum TaxID=1962263 RepID=A0A1S9IHW4_9CLOT|nr:hypothetical protein [Clostridium tepidum]OOO69909.1 hypothetical protein BS638_00545 [Clostridium tepidum]